MNFYRIRCRILDIVLGQHRSRDRKHVFHLLFTGFARRATSRRWLLICYKVIYVDGKCLDRGDVAKDLGN